MEYNNIFVDIVYICFILILNFIWLLSGLVNVMEILKPE